MGTNFKSVLVGILLCAITALGAPIQQQHAVVARKMAAAGGGFSYTSVIFDGTNDYLLRGGDPIPDGKQGTLSVWLRMGSGSSDSTTYYLMGNAGNAFYIRRSSGGFIQIVAGVNGVVSTNNLVIADGWVHVLSSWDTAIPGAFYIYFNGVNATPAIVNVDTATDYSTGEWKIGDLEGGSSKWNGLVCELWLTDTYIDITSSGNRDKFFNSGTTKPVDLGSNGSTPTGTQPRIYLRNGFATWQTNLGSGGNFTVTGALGDGGADKP